MSAQQNIALVQRFYDAYIKGEKDMPLSCMADDIDWDIPEIASFRQLMDTLKVAQAHQAGQAPAAPGA